MRPDTPTPRPFWARRTVDGMAGGEQECAGRWDIDRCPKNRRGVPAAGERVFRCLDCREDWELHETEPERRLVADDGLTRPTGDPREAGHGTPV